MKSFAVSFTEATSIGPAWSEYWSLRKAEFVDHKGWDLPHIEGVEFDWYDRPGARWIIVTDDDGRCVGGSRLLRTDAPSYGGCSYMLRDAQLGLISGIPIGMLPPNLPLDPQLFEATRFFVDRALPMKQQMLVQREIVARTASTARELGGRELIALMPSKIYRIFRRFGFEVREHSEVGVIDSVPHTVGWLSVF
jgi:N-acyl-L-homoserine lactone synthetase